MQVCDKIQSHQKWNLKSAEIKSWVTKHKISFFVQFFQVHSNNSLPSNLPVLDQQLNLLQQVDFLVLPHLLSVQLQHLQQVPLANLNSKPQVLLANLNSKPDLLVCSAQIIKPSLLVRNFSFFFYVTYFTHSADRQWGLRRIILFGDNNNLLSDDY